MEERTPKSVKVAVALALVVFLSCPVLFALATAGMINLDPWPPSPDQSGDIAQAIPERYEAKVTEVRVRRANDILSATDYPFAHRYRRWGYRADYRLDGVPLTIHLKIDQDEDVRFKGNFKGVFPDEFDLEESDFKKILIAYAAGSGETEFACMEVPGVFRQAPSNDYPEGWTTFLIWPHVDDLRAFTADTKEDPYVVRFDYDAREATYLGR